VHDRFDFILGLRVRGKPAIVGFVFLGALAVSLLVFLVWGNRMTVRVLFFPVGHGRALAAEERFLPRHRGIDQEVKELVDGVLLGPMRNDSARLFPRGAQAIAALVRGRILYLDLPSRVLADDSEIPLKGRDALEALTRSIRFNFPQLHEIVYYIDGQAPSFSEKKNI